MPHWIDWIIGLISTPSAAQAILFSLLCGYGAIPAFIWLLRGIADSLVQDIPKVVSFLLAGLAASSLWPQHGPIKIIAFIAFGFIPPVTYSYGIRAAKHFWPWLFKGASDGDSGRS